jgi:hypothetical protein
MYKRRNLRKAWVAREARLDRSKVGEMLPVSMRLEEDRPGLNSEQRAGKLLKKLQQSIEDGDMLTAQANFESWMRAVGKNPPRETLLEIIKALHDRQGLAASVPAMRALCKLYPENADKVRLKLASILIRELQRPTEGYRHLEQIAVEKLELKHQRFREKLVAEAAQMIEEGVLEVEEE